MAPKQVKRAASKAPTEEPAAKRVAYFLKQQGVSKVSYQPVIEILKHPLSNLPEGVRGMLLASAPYSLAVPQDQRHEAQHGVVGMVDGMVQAVLAQLQENLASQVSTVEMLEGEKVAEMGKAEEAEVAAVEAGNVVKSCTEQLSEAEAMVATRQATASETELVAKSVQTELEATRSLSAQFEEVLSGSFVSLKEGNFEDGAAEGLVENVMAMVNQSNMEESLTATLPPCLAKRERGSFDMVVLGQAEEGLRAKAQSLVEAIAQLEEQFSAKTATTQAAGAELDAAKATQAEAAEELRSGQESSQGALDKACEAKRAVADCEGKLAVAQARLEQKQGEADNFKSYHKFMFELLRDATTSKPQAEAATSDAPVEESVEKPVEEPAAEVAADAQVVVGNDESLAKIPEQLDKDVVVTMAGVAGA